MSTRLFNFTNQRLSADKLREVLAFNSDNFGGIIADNSPFTISDDIVTLNASEASPISFLGGGLLINETSEKTFSLAENNKLVYLEVTLDPSVANITTDELIEIIDEETVNKLQYQSKYFDFVDGPKSYFNFSVVTHAEGSPKDNGYYEIEDNKFILSEDTEVDLEKVYYCKIDYTSFRFMISSLSTSAFTYYGNTIWVSNDTFIIPLFARINDEIVQLVNIRSLTDFEGLLSAGAYARLKKYCEETFVWRSGGVEKGDIGSLNVTEDLIKNRTEGNSVKIENLTITNIANSKNDGSTKLVVSSSGNISANIDYIEPIAHGGTGASNKQQAKTNLGIYYGRQQTPSGSYQEGDIYLWIIE